MPNPVTNFIAVEIAAAAEETRRITQETIRSMSRTVKQSRLLVEESRELLLRVDEAAAKRYAALVGSGLRHQPPRSSISRAS